MSDSEAWLYVTSISPQKGTPNISAFSAGNAVRYDTFGDAITATGNLPPGQFPWIMTEGAVFSPEQLKPIRKLRYRRSEL